MDTDRGSELPADCTRGEPGSEAIAFAESPQQRNAVPSLEHVLAADKLATHALSLLSVYRREADPKSPELVDSARVRLELALKELGHPVARRMHELHEQLRKARLREAELERIIADQNTRWAELVAGVVDRGGR